MDSAVNQDMTLPQEAPNASSLARQDAADALKQWRIWVMLAYQDIKLRYRRSILGPFWITLSMAVTVYSMGFLYAHLFHTEMQSYYPFLVAGMLGWSFISSSVSELTDAFTSSDGLMKQIKLPYTLYVHRIATRNMIIFFHNLIVMVPILLIFHQVAKVNFYSLLFIPNLILIYFNTITFGLILAIIGARYRDVSQIIKNLIQVAFFVTPIMWNPSVLPPQYQPYMYLNPCYIFVELIRAPMCGSFTTWTVYGIALLITGISLGICAKLFTRYRSRIIYWL